VRRGVERLYDRIDLLSGPQPATRGEYLYRPHAATLFVYAARDTSGLSERIAARAIPWPLSVDAIQQADAADRQRQAAVLDTAQIEAFIAGTGTNAFDNIWFRHGERLVRTRSCRGCRASITGPRSTPPPGRRASPKSERTRPPRTSARSRYRATAWPTDLVSSSSANRVSPAVSSRWPTPELRGPGSFTAAAEPWRRWRRFRLGRCEVQLCRWPARDEPPRRRTAPTAPIPELPQPRSAPPPLPPASPRSLPPGLDPARCLTALIAGIRARPRRRWPLRGGRSDRRRPRHRRTPARVVGAPGRPHPDRRPAPDRHPPRPPDLPQGRPVRRGQGRSQHPAHRPRDPWPLPQRQLPRHAAPLRRTRQPSDHRRRRAWHRVPRQIARRRAPRRARRRVAARRVDRPRCVPRGAPTPLASAGRMVRPRPARGLRTARPSSDAAPAGAPHGGPRPRYSAASPHPQPPAPARRIRRPPGPSGGG
jgi:hypothetical protein